MIQGARKYGTLQYFLFLHRFRRNPPESGNSDGFRWNGPEFRNSAGIRRNGPESVRMDIITYIHKGLALLTFLKH